MSAFTVAIIAGGRSTRMGKDKSFVKLRGKPMIEWVKQHVAYLGQAETILVTNKPDLYAYLGLPMYSDILPDKGSLGGIYTALHYARYPHALTVACDMPFLRPDLLRYLLALRNEPAGPYDIIVPRQQGYPEGLHAVYHQNCLSAIRQRIEANELKIIGFYDGVKVRYVDEQEYAQLDPRGLSFRNVNSPDELREAENLIS